MDKVYKNEINKELSDREREVLKLLTLGKNNEEIAKELSITIYTVKAHITSLFSKMNVKDRLQAVVKAIDEGWV